MLCVRLPTELYVSDYLWKRFPGTLGGVHSQLLLGRGAGLGQSLNCHVRVVEVLLHHDLRSVVLVVLLLVCGQENIQH